MCQFDWLNIFYFQAKFGKERVRANKVIVNYPKFATRFAQFGGVVWRPSESHCGMVS